jgi:replicative DNA helicase
MGKTALALYLAKEQAKRGGAVGVFSLEMSVNQLIDRIFASETEIDLQTIRKGGLQRDQWTKLDNSTIQVMEYPLFVCDKGGLSITEITGIAKGWHLKHNLKAIYIDYIQLISGSGQKGQNREQEVSEISRKLKVLAKELNIPIIALSQLSRACEARSDKRPMLSDLRESGAIEQDADMVIFPFCPNYYDDNADKELCEINIAKYRNGKTGMIEIRFQKNIQKFSELNQNPF